MTQIENKEIKVEMQLRGIELLDSSLSLPTNKTAQTTNYNFNITVESKADPVNKLVFVIVSIEIRNDDHSQVLGSAKVSCIFNIGNFEEMIKMNETGIAEINPVLVEILNSVSFSTTRGVMFGIFKGTFLHNVILPIIDPKQISIVAPQQEK